ncbi:MAG: competence/damage-inducible protein A [Gemmatimonadetes bacterium]|nr:competence/damage-inducible protein A [Gemmatimonadota bacterium]
MEIEIVAIGNELLLGETVDTNSAAVARRLAEIGGRVVRVTMVGDDPERMAVVLREVRGRARWAIAMGGLGPTGDDRTRQVVAEVLGRPLVLDEEQLEIVKEKFRRFGYDEMPASNVSQAMVPRGARAVANPHGTAPGLVIEEEGFTLFVLPGVPKEMEALLEDAVLPALIEAAGKGAPVVESRVVHTVGIGESALAEKLEDLVESADPLEVAFLPRTGQVDVRLTAAGLPAEEAGARLTALAEAIAGRARPWFWGYDDTTLAEAIGETLRARGWVLAVAESCTAGLLGGEITTVPGSSEWFAGGVLAYSDEVKTSLLGIAGEDLAAYGAVSEETCRAMAAGARKVIGADVGCAITGIAGPGGGSEEKPVGLVFCGVATPEGAEVRRLTYPGSREDIRRRSVLTAMGMLLRACRGEGGAS